MKGKTRWLWLAVAGMALAACARAGTAATPMQAAPTATEAWQSECLHATVRALEMERKTYSGWLAQASGDQAETYRRALAYLDAALGEYRSLNPRQFRIANVYRYIPGVVTGWYGTGELGQPKPFVLNDAWVEHSPPALLFYAGMSRSGPFYTVVGVPRDDFSALKPGVHYRMVLQPLMPATYPFPAFYVCVEKFEAVEK